MINVLVNPNTIIATVTFMIPILLAAIGGSICVKSGNFNIALEGFILIGAFGAVVGDSFMNSTFWGIVIAILFSSLLAMVYGIFVFSLNANEIIAGFGTNMFALGLTGWMLVPVFGGKGSYYDPSMPILEKFSIPLLSKIPGLKYFFSNHNIIAYSAVILLVLAYIFMYKTPWGYRLRALGENPQALKSVGLHERFYRYLAVLICSVFCGIAGAFISISDLAMFTENISAGKGYIAVSAVIFSRAYLPVTLIISLVFGFAFSIIIQLQGYGIPTEFIEMTPYFLTVIALVISSELEKAKLTMK